MNRDQRRKQAKLSPSTRGQIEKLAAAFKKAKAAGEDAHFVAVLRNGITVMWTGPKGQEAAERLLLMATGQHMSLSGKSMVMWKAQTEDELDLVQGLRERLLTE